jgi:membrane protein DedA with SNARE-associated domain
VTVGLANQLPDLLARYGYFAIAGIIMLESMGLPLPGETTLVTASIYAGTTHNMSIWLVILAAVAGAVIGDNIGYWIGEKLGYRVLLRHGARVGITERKIKLGQYLFTRHGGKVVFFGRFVAVLRVLAAFLAGVNCMHWNRFFIANLCGAILWAALFGLGAYTFGKAIDRVTGPVGLTAIGITVVGVLIATAIARRHESQLEVEAERALPGPLRRP